MVQEKQTKGKKIKIKWKSSGGRGEGGRLRLDKWKGNGIKETRRGEEECRRAKKQDQNT